MNLREKGTPLHAATVVGDTVGDPFKDTSSVALNPIIKFTTLFGLLAVELAIEIKPPEMRYLWAGLLVCRGARVRLAFVLLHADFRMNAAATDNRCDHCSKLSCRCEQRRVPLAALAERPKMIGNRRFGRTHLGRAVGRGG